MLQARYRCLLRNYLLAAAFVAVGGASCSQDGCAADELRALDGPPSGEPDYKLLYSPDRAGLFTFGFAAKEKPRGFPPRGGLYSNQGLVELVPIRSSDRRRCHDSGEYHGSQPILQLGNAAAQK